MAKSFARIIYNDGSSEEIVSSLTAAECAEKLSWGVSVPLADGGLFYAELGSLRSFTVTEPKKPENEGWYSGTSFSYVLPSEPPEVRDERAWFTPRGPLK